MKMRMENHRLMPLLVAGFGLVLYRAVASYTWHTAVNVHFLPKS